METIPQDYLEACDEAGILVIQEMPFGLSTLRANRYTIDSRFREYYSKELDGLVRVSRNHASVVAYSMSSELEFSNQTQNSFDFFSRDLVRQTREIAPHALAIDCTGYLNSEETDKGRRDTDFYASVHPKWMKEVLDEDDMDYGWETPDHSPRIQLVELVPRSERPREIQERTAPSLLAGYPREDGLGRTVRANSFHCTDKLSVAPDSLPEGWIEYSRRNPGVEGYYPLAAGRLRPLVRRSSGRLLETRRMFRPRNSSSRMATRCSSLQRKERGAFPWEPWLGFLWR